MKIKFFKEGELKLLWPFYLDALISSILFFMPAFLVIYFMNLGFSLFQISILEMMMPLAFFIFEIPTGIVADIYGRKFSVLLGSLIEGLGIFSIFFFNNFYILLFSFALIGFGETFNSGAREAWIIDLIKKEKKNFSHQYFAKRNSINGVGLFLSGIVGAFLVKQFGLPIIWIVAGISCLITFMLLSLVKKDFIIKKIKKNNSAKNIFNHLKISIQYLKKNNLLLLFFIFGAILSFANEFRGDLVWIPLLQSLNFPEYALGYMWSVMGLVSIFAPLVSLKFLKKGKEKKFMLVAASLIIPILLLILFVKNFVFALAILFSCLFFTQMSYPVESIYLHKLTKSKIRATIGSLSGMLAGIVGIISAPLVGLSIDKFGSRNTLLLSAILIIPAIIILLRIKDKK